MVPQRVFKQPSTRSGERTNAGKSDPAMSERCERTRPGPDRIIEPWKGPATELLIAGSVLLLALAAQWILATLVPGTNYYGVEDRMAQATTLAAFRFAGYFDV